MHSLSCSLLLALCLHLFFYYSVVQGSEGDRNPTYRQCLRETSRLCNNDPKSNNVVHDFYPMSIIKWNCFDQVKYKCMRAHNEERISQNLKLYKYYGHWCFERYLGLEEPGSVLFSVLNILPPMLYVSNFLFRSRSDVIYDYGVVLYSLVGINAWVASTLFHSHKTPTFIMYDYVSALLFVACGLLLALRRLLGSVTNMYVLRLVFFVGCGLVGWRVNQMMMGKVSFSSHMTLCIGIVVVTTIIWVLWCLHGAWLVRNNKRKINTQLRWKMFICQLFFIAATSLELFDFPAFFGLFDAHALWHAATVPIGFYWFHVWIEDGREAAAAALAVDAEVVKTATALETTDKKSKKEA